MGDDRDELRFAKTQQWYVAAAAVSLYAGTYAALKACERATFGTVTIGIVTLVREVSNGEWLISDISLLGVHIQA